MENMNVSSFLESGQKIETLKISGFDLIVETNNAQKITIENGVSEVLVNNISLPGASGEEINFEHIVATIPNDGSGFDSVYLEDMFSLTESDQNEDQQQLNVDVQSRYEQLITLLAQLEDEIDKKEKDLSEKNKALKEKEDDELQEQYTIEAMKEDIEQREILLEQQAQQIAERLEKLEAAKAQEEEKTSAEKLREEQQQAELPKVPTAAAPQEQAPQSSSDGDSSDQAPTPEIEIPELGDEIELFVSGVLDKNSDSGKVGDNITNDRTPTFVGKTMPNITVNLTVGGTIYSVKADEKGNWKFTLPNGLDNGDYEYTISVSGSDGSTDSQNGSFTVDANAATLTDVAWFNSEAEHTDLVNKSRPTLNGQSAPGAIVVLEIEGKTYKTVANEKGEWSIIVNTALPDGRIDYKLTASTVAGSTDSVEATVTVDTSIDTTYFSLDSATDSGVKQDFITNHTRPSFTGQTEAGANVEIIINDQQFTVRADASGKWTFTASELADGSYKIEVNITDAAGNTLTQSSNITIDTTAPDTTLYLIREDGSVVTNGAINSQTPTFSGFTEPQAVVTITINGIEYQTTADHRGRWSMTFDPALPEGKYDYIVSIIDLAGNNTTTHVDSFQVDVSAPVNPSTGLSHDTDTGIADDNTTSYAAPTLSGQGEAGSTIFIIFENGESYQTVVNANGNWSLGVGPFVDGQYNYKVYAQDAAGNQSSEVSGNIIIDTIQPQLTGSLEALSDSSNPETEGSDTDGRSNDSTPTFSGTATPGQTVILNFNGKDYSFPVGEDGVWSITVDALIPGEHEGPIDYNISVTTPSGNRTEMTGTYIYDTTVESTAGLAANSDSGADSTDSITNDKRPHFSGQAEPGSTITLTYEGVDYPIIVAEDGSWRMEYPLLADLEDGTYSYTLNVTDAAGNNLPAQEHSFVIDTVAKTSYGLASSSVGGDGTDPLLTNDSKPTFTGKAEPGSTVTFIFPVNAADADGNPITPQRYEIPVAEDGSWRFTLPNGLTVGEYDYTVETSDKAGNSDSYNGKFQYMLDGDAPPKGNIAIDEEDDSGDKGDMITNNNTPTFTGSVEPVTSTGKIFINGVEYPLVINVETGTYTFELPEGTSLREGNNYYEVEFTHPDNGLKQTISGNLTVDSISSEIEVTLDTDTGSTGDWHTKTRVNTFSGEADAGAKVQLVIGENTYTTTVRSDGTWSIELPDSLNDGRYEVDVTITDLAGNESTFHKDLVVDNVNSNFSLIQGPGYEIAGGGWGYNNGPSFYIRGETFENDKNATVKLTYGGKTQTFKITDLIQFTGENRLEDNKLYFGQVKIEVTDSAGNVSVQYHNNVVSYFFNPTITGGLTAESNSDDKEDQITTDTTPDFAGTTNADYAWFTNYSGTIVIDDTSYPITVSNVDGKVHWSFTYPDSAPALGPGKHEYTVTIVSSDGNQSGSFSDEFNISTLNIGLDDGSNSGELDDWFTNNDSPVIGGTTSGDATIRVQFNGVYYNVPVESDGSWTFTPPGAPLADGIYDVSIQESVDGVVTTVHKELVIDKVAPEECTIGVASDSLPGSNAMTTGDNTPKLQGNTEPGATVRVTIAGQLHKVTADENGLWMVQITDPLPAGTNNYTVNVTDRAGNTMESPLTGQLVVDSEFDASLNYKLDGMPDVTGGDYRTDDMVMVGTGRPGMTVTFTSAGQTLTTTVDENGFWTLDAGHLFSNHADGARYSARKLVFTDPETGAHKTIVFNVVFDQHVVDAWVGLDPSSQTATGDDDTLTNHTEPTLKGRGEAYNKVLITINNEVHEVRADSQGYWTFKVPGPLNNGSYEYSVTVVDKNNREHTDTGSFTVNSDVPTLSVEHTGTGVEDGNFDSNIDGDGITNVKDHSFSGQINPANTLVFKLNGVVKNVTLDEDGNWTLDLQQLEDGVYNYEVEVTTPSGMKDTVTGSFTVDTQVAEASNIELDLSTDSGTAGDNITNNTNPKFTGAAEPGSTVTLVINGETYTGTADQHGRWSITVTDALPGDQTHSYTVTVKDVAGNTSEGVNGELTVTTTPTGEATIDVSLSNDPNADGIIKETKPQIGGTATAGASIQVVIDGKTYNTIANADGQWNITLTAPLEDGAHSLTANVVDVAGNVIASDNLNFTVDSTVEAELSGVVDNAGDVRDGFTNDTTPTFKGTAEAGSTVVIVIDGQTKEVVVGDSGLWELTLDTALTDDTYNYEITITDKSGNEKDIEGLLTVDTEAPTEIEGGLAAGSFVTGHEDVTISDKPNFSGTTEPGATITLTIGDKVFTATANELGAWEIDYVQSGNEPLTDGSYDFSISVTDKAGNTINTPYTDNFTVANEKPSADSSLLASSDSGEKGDALTNNTTPSIGGTTSIGGSITIILADGTEHAALVNADGSWSFQFPIELGEGEHNYTVKATDKYGNETTKPGSFTVDTTLPDAPSNIIIQGAEDGVTGDSTPILSGQAEAGSTVYIVIDGRTYTAQVNEEGQWSYDFSQNPPLANKEHEYSITVKDAAGNTSSVAQGSFTVAAFSVALAPESDSWEPGDNLTNDQTPTFNGTGTPGATITLTISGTSYVTTVQSNGSWTVTVNNPLEDGNQGYTVSEDYNGHISQAQGSIMIDATAPSTVIVNTELQDEGDTVQLNEEGSITFKGKAEEGATVSIMIDGYSTPIEVKMLPNGEWSTTSHYYPIPEGETRGYTVTVTDIRGNVSEYSGVLAGSTPPPVPEPEPEPEVPTDPEASRMMSEESQTTTFSGQAPSASLVALDINQQSYLTVADQAGDWAIDVPLTVLATGNNPYTLLVSDDEGNEHLSTGIFNTDGSEMIGAIDIADVTEELIDFEGSSAAYAKVTLSIEHMSYTTYADAEGQWNMQVVKPDLDAEYSYSVKSEINNEVVSTYEGQFTVGKQQTEVTEQDTQESVKTDEMVTFEGTLSENYMEVEFTFNGKTIEVEYDQNRTNWKVDVPMESVAYENTYQVKIIDINGNEKATSGVFESETFVETERDFSQQNNAYVNLDEVLTSLEHSDEF